MEVMIKRRKKSKRRARLEEMKGMGYENNWAIEGTDNIQQGSSIY
jgi:hypothetical protein